MKGKRFKEIRKLVEIFILDSPRSIFLLKRKKKPKDLTDIFLFSSAKFGKFFGEKI